MDPEEPARCESGPKPVKETRDRESENDREPRKNELELTQRFVRRPTDQASAALKGPPSALDLKRLMPDTTTVIEAEPFNVRLHAVVGRHAA